VGARTIDQLERAPDVPVVQRQGQRLTAGEQRPQQRGAVKRCADDAAEGRPAGRDRVERRAAPVDGFADPDQ
jgi:hypothetical protein